VKIERPTAADQPGILALNESALPHVDRISAGDLDSWRSVVRGTGFLGFVRGTWYRGFVASPGF